MKTTRVFKSGNSQNLARAFELLANLPEDFFSEGRNDTPPQDREFFE